jgi:hypothetical protein
MGGSVRTGCGIRIATEVDGVGSAELADAEEPAWADGADTVGCGGVGGGSGSGGLQILNQNEDFLDRIRETNASYRLSSPSDS